MMSIICHIISAIFARGRVRERNLSFQNSSSYCERIQNDLAINSAIYLSCSYYYYFPCCYFITIKQQEKKPIYNCNQLFLFRFENLQYNYQINFYYLFLIYVLQNNKIFFPTKLLYKKITRVFLCYKNFKDFK